MSFLPPVKRLALEDFPGQKSWISNIIEPLNRFFQNVYSNLNHGLTFKDNLQAMVSTLTVDQVYPLQFLNTMRVKPVGLWVVNTVEIADIPATITSAVTLDWTYNGEGQVEINDITGLTAGKRYSLTVIVIGG